MPRGNCFAKIDLEREGIALHAIARLVKRKANCGGSRSHDRHAKGKLGLFGEKTAEILEVKGKKLESDLRRRILRNLAY